MRRPLDRGRRHAHEFVAVQNAMSAGDSTAVEARVVVLEGEVTSLRGELARAQDALASLRARYLQLLEELHLLKRRLHVAKAERLDDVAGAQLAFDTLMAEAKLLEKVLADADKREDPGASPLPPPPKKKAPSRKPTGRRKLSDCDLPEVRVEIPDPELEGKFERIGFEESSRVGFERGGRRRVVCARVVYKNSVTDESQTNKRAGDGRPAAVKPEPRVDIRVAPMPKEIMRARHSCPVDDRAPARDEVRARRPVPPLRAADGARRASRSTAARCAATPSTSGQRSAASSRPRARRPSPPPSASPPTPRGRHPADAHSKASASHAARGTSS